MEFDNLDSRPGMSRNLLLANMYPAKLPTVLDCPKCTRENTLNYGKM